MDVSAALDSARRALKKTFEYNPCDQWRNPLYLVTLVAQAPAVAARWLLGYAAFSVLGSLLFDPFHDAMLFALAPIFWSLLAFRFPGSGWLWHRARGAREPSTSESERYCHILDELGDEAWGAAVRVEMVVVDHPDSFALMRGIVYTMSRGLLGLPYGKAVTVHELFHGISGAARLSQALERFILWRDPFAGLAEYAKGQNGLVRLVCFVWRWLFRIAGGSLVLEYGPLQRAWAASYRREEEAADAFAGKLGQNLLLADFLEKYELPRERPRRRGLFDSALHPFIQYRIDALRQMSLED